MPYLSPYTTLSLPLRGEVNEAVKLLPLLYSCTTSASLDIDDEDVLLRGRLPKSLLISTCRRPPISNLFTPPCPLARPVIWLLSALTQTARVSSLAFGDSKAV